MLRCAAPCYADWVQSRSVWSTDLHSRAARAGLNWAELGCAELRCAEQKLRKAVRCRAVKGRRRKQSNPFSKEPFATLSENMFSGTSYCGTPDSLFGFQHSKKGGPNARHMAEVGSKLEPCKSPRSSLDVVGSLAMSLGISYHRLSGRAGSKAGAVQVASQAPVQGENHEASGAPHRVFKRETKRKPSISRESSNLWIWIPPVFGALKCHLRVWDRVWLPLFWLKSKGSPSEGCSLGGVR